MQSCDRNRPKMQCVDFALRCLSHVHSQVNTMHTLQAKEGGPIAARTSKFGKISGLKGKNSVKLPIEATVADLASQQGQPLMMQLKDGEKEHQQVWAVVPSIWKPQSGGPTFLQSMLIGLWQNQSLPRIEYKIVRRKWYWWWTIKCLLVHWITSARKSTLIALTCGSSTWD